MSEGLQKLAEYLNQTRRQAELSIDSLNERISILSTENKDLQKNLDSLFEERNYYKELAERLQLENSKKWKFQERDDWKSLVDSVQRDRSRLQEENTALTEMLQLEKEKNNILEQEIATLTNKYDNLIQELDAIKVEKENQMSNNHSMDYELLPVTPVKSKILEDEAMSPRSSVHTLKAELEHLTRKLNLERKISESEIRAQTEEIKRLKEELGDNQKISHQNNITDFTTFHHPQPDYMNDQYLNNNVAESKPSGLFLWNEVVNFFFPSNSSTFSLNNPHFHTKILHV